MNDELGTAVGPHVATRAAIAYLTSLIGRAVLNVVSLPVDNGTATPVERSGPLTSDTTRRPAAAHLTLQPLSMLWQ